VIAWVSSQAADQPLRGTFKMKFSFRTFTQRTAELMGSPWSFVAGLVMTVIWATTGPVFHFSDTWQLAINTGTTIITFLMVFVIQNTQSRDAKAMQLKLDELIRAVGAARTKLVHLENLTDDELAGLELEFQKLHEKLQQKLVTTTTAPPQELTVTGQKK
jgi:low affinity Fe/Cu permease